MKIFLAIVCACLCHFAKCQYTVSGSITDIPTVANTFFANSLGSNRVLYNGCEYNPTQNKIKGTPYFEGLDFENGNIFYDQVLCKNVPLMYDLYIDKPITLHPNKVFKIELVEGLIEYFTINNNIFVKIIQQDSMNSDLKSGFYQLLYNGITKVYAKHKVSVTDNRSNDIVTMEYSLSTDYFIQSNSRYHKVSNLRSAYRLIPQHKKAIKKFLSHNKAAIDGSHSKTLVTIAQQHDILTGNAK